LDSDGFELASGRQLRSRARHSAFADLRFRPSDSWQVSLNGQYLADLFDLDDDEVHTRLPSILVVDAKATVRLSDRLSAYLAVSNITDENYYFRIGDPRPGRAFGAGFMYDRQAQ
jgi:outer membrane receptor protein involved in Fe transport